MKKYYSLIAICCILMYHATAQKTDVRGFVFGRDGKALASATVRVENSHIVVLTNEDGSFSINNMNDSNKVIEISYIGYETIKIPKWDVSDIKNIYLKELDNINDEVVVTGVFDPRKRMEASVAISTLNSSQLEKMSPISSSDLLKSIPGVYVNSSNGEIRNSVTSRGITPGSSDGTFGYEYVSMQEDGLPITNTTYFSYGPDLFLRPDATLARVDAVRGGTASITAANAPGGIFNYISRQGGAKFEGEIRVKYGRVGNWSNDYRRIDGDFGGPLGNGWYYNIGGFFRNDQGAHYAGYAMNKGGLVKGNLVKKYQRGSFKVFIKIMDDRNGFPIAIPTIGYTNPTLANGFNNNATLLPPKYQYNYADYFGTGTMQFDPSKLVKIKYNSAVLNWDHDIGNGWKLSEAARVSDNKLDFNTVNGASSSITDVTTYGLIGALGIGTYTYQNAKTGEVLANVTSTPVIANGQIVGFNYSVANNHLLGQDVAPNSILMSTLNLDIPAKVTT